MKKIIKPEQWVMLPTEDKNSPLGITANNLIKFTGAMGIKALGIGQPQHLYLVSDEEVKDGDWCLFFDSVGNLFTDRPQQYKPKEGHVLNDGLKKVIATTDKSLGLLSIREMFIKHFVESKGRAEEVLFEQAVEIPKKYDTYLQIPTKEQQPIKHGWYNTDKGELYWHPREEEWSCRDEYVSEEYPKYWYKRID